MQKEQILELFSDSTKEGIKDKEITSSFLMYQGKKLHIIYIADDKEIKDFYDKEFTKSPSYMKYSNELS